MDDEVIEAKQNTIIAALKAELQRHGFLCESQLHIGMSYIDLEGHKNFIIEVGRDFVQTGKHFPDSLRYTGRCTIHYQGFCEGKAHQIMEPDGGFDFEAVVRELIPAIEQSDQRRDEHYRARAEAERSAQEQANQLMLEFQDSPTIKPDVHFCHGEFVCSFSLSLTGMTRDQVWVMLRLLHSEIVEPPGVNSGR